MRYLSCLSYRNLIIQLAVVHLAIPKLNCNFGYFCHLPKKLLINSSYLCQTRPARQDTLKFCKQNVVFWRTGSICSSNWSAFCEFYAPCWRNLKVRYNPAYASNWRNPSMNSMVLAGQFWQMVSILISKIRKWHRTPLVKCEPPS